MTPYNNEWKLASLTTDFAEWPYKSGTEDNYWWYCFWKQRRSDEIIDDLVLD